MRPEAKPRRPVIAANWKMNKDIAETETFIKEFSSLYTSDKGMDIVICPPFISLANAKTHLNEVISLGAQNINENESGAFTGEVSPSMLTSIGCQYVIIGHSERRQYYGETDEGVNKKIKTALKHNLIPIMCVGETLEQREAGKESEVVQTQLQNGLKDISSADLQKIVIAYEPIWAIGTGKTASPAQAQEMHLAIRNTLKELYGSNPSLKIRILYGGSVKPENMAELMDCEDVDGGLVGGASLNPDSFFKIVNYFEGK